MDVQAVGVAVSGILAALGTVLAGIYTGKNGRLKDESEARVNLQNARLQREAAEQVASKSRIEGIAADAAEARLRLREAEDDFERELRESRNYAQRGWDLARYHFSMFASLAHLLNNIFAVEALSEDPEGLRTTVQTARRRMEAMGKMAVSLEEPLDRLKLPKQD